MQNRQTTAAAVRTGTPNKGKRDTYSIIIKLVNFMLCFFRSSGPAFKSPLTKKGTSSPAQTNNRISEAPSASIDITSLYENALQTIDNMLDGVICGVDDDRVGDILETVKAPAEKAYASGNLIE